jgi:hypothetical protein
MMQEIIVSVQPIQEIVDKIVQEQKVLSVLVLVRLLVDLPSHQRMVVVRVVEKEHIVLEEAVELLMENIVVKREGIVFNK